MKNFHIPNPLPALQSLRGKFSALVDDVFSAREEKTDFDIGRDGSVREAFALAARLPGIHRKDVFLGATEALKAGRPKTLQALFTATFPDRKNPHSNAIRPVFTHGNGYFLAIVGKDLSTEQIRLALEKVDPVVRQQMLDEVLIRAIEGLTETAEPTDYVRKIVAAGANVNAYKGLALRDAIEQKNWGMATALYDLGADFDTALDQAEDSQDQTTRDILELYKKLMVSDRKLKEITAQSKGPAGPVA